MAKYTFKAQTASGNIVIRHNVESVDDRELIADQRAKGNEVFYIRQRAEKANVKEFSPRELANFSHELSVMLTSGLTAVRALSIMASQTTARNRRLVAIYADLADLLKKGYSISEACRKQGGAFPELLINALYSGEASGNMPLVTRQMSEYYERIVKVNQKIKGATTYPKVLLAMTVVIVLAMFTFILPQFLSSGLFEGVELPNITVLMFAISDFFTKHALAAILGIAVVYFLMKAFLRTTLFRSFYDRLLFSIPVIGGLMKTMCTARFAATLSYLHNSGIILTTAVPIAANATNNSYIVEQMTAGVKKMGQGEMLSAVLSKTDGFSQRLTHIALIGEETGKLGEVMTNMSAAFDDETDAAVSRLLTLLTPALLGVMAIVVGAVVMSVMLPIFTLYQNM